MNIFTYDFTQEIVDWDYYEEDISSYLRAYYIYDGRLFYQDNEHNLELKNHSLYLLPTTKPFHVIADKNAVLNSLWFHIDIFPLINQQLKVLTVKNNSFLSHLMDALKAESIVNKNIDSVKNSLVEALKNYLERECVLEDINEPIKTIVKYINANISKNDLSVAELASLINCTQAHLIRIFSKEIGTTPYQYILNRRMNMAKNLLVSGFSVNDVSYKVGYEIPRVFSRIYKIKFGISPEETINENKVLRLKSEITN